MSAGLGCGGALAFWARIFGWIAVAFGMCIVAGFAWVCYDDIRRKRP